MKKMIALAVAATLSICAQSVFAGERASAGADINFTGLVAAETCDLGVLGPDGDAEGSAIRLGTVAPSETGPLVSFTIGAKDDSTGCDALVDAGVTHARLIFNNLNANGVVTGGTATGSQILLNVKQGGVDKAVKTGADTFALDLVDDGGYVDGSGKFKFNLNAQLQGGTTAGTVTGVTTVTLNYL